MDRPKLDKPRLEMWKTDDKNLSKFLEFAKKKSLNVNKWEFRIPAINKMVSYQHMTENIQERYPEFIYVEASKRQPKIDPQRQPNFDPPMVLVCQSLSIP